MLLVAQLVRVVLFTKQPLLEKAYMYLPFFFNGLLFSVQFFDFRYTILPRLIFFDCICHLKKSCEFNISRRLNVRCIKSKNILLCFIASSFWNSMLYLLQLRAIIYCSNNTSLLAILMHSLPISNGFFFLDEGRIHLSYSTSTNKYGSLICAKYKKYFLCLQQIEWE